MTYGDAAAFIESTKNLGSRPGLENIAKLCAALGDPQDALCCIHVAGTNGKGSTSAMIASMLSSAGYKTGLYVSPHLISYRDSMAVNGREISKGEFAKIISVIKRKAKILASKGITPTEFEILTVAAFLWFHSCGCDFAVIETCLGGRLDATNIIKKPLISVLTALSKDHTAILGDTISAITREKCGIIKPAGVTVCYPVQENEAWTEIKKAVQQNNNTLVIPQLNDLAFEDKGLFGSDISYAGMQFYLPLPGKHQVINALTALEAVLSLQKLKDVAITAEQMITGMKSVRLPARQEVLKKKPLILLDGAHNLQGMEALFGTIKNHIRNKKIAVIMGILKDKQFEECIRLIAPLAGRFIAVKPQNERALDENITAGVAAKVCGNVASYYDYGKAFEDALMFAGEEGAVVICGSLYLAGPMREIILSNKHFVF